MQHSSQLHAIWLLDLRDRSLVCICDSPRVPVALRMQAASFQAPACPNFTVDAIAGLFPIVLDLMEGWMQSQEAEGDPAPVPKWLDALLLCLDIAMHALPSLKDEGKAFAGADAAAAQLAAGPGQAALSAQDAGPSTAADAATDALAAGQATRSAEAADPSTPAPAGSTGAAPAAPAKAHPKSEAEKQDTAFLLMGNTIKSLYLPTGLLSQQQFEQAAALCMRLLQHLHRWGASWQASPLELLLAQQEACDAELCDRKAAGRLFLHCLARHRCVGFA